MSCRTVNCTKKRNPKNLIAELFYLYFLFFTISYAPQNGAIKKIKIQLDTQKQATSTEKYKNDGSQTR